MFDASAIDRCLNGFVEREMLMGCGLMLYSKGKVVYKKSFGFAAADGSRPFAGDTLVRCYSVSKTFTCAGLMQLFEKGAFTLDTPVAEFLPEFSDPVVCKTPGSMEETEPARRPITIRHLLTMTSGIPYMSFVPGEGPVQDAMFGEIVQMAANVQSGQNTYCLGDLVKMIASHPLCFHPGEHWMYGFSHAVLGRLIEVISGKTLGEYLSHHIWQPLGLTNTFFNNALPAGAQLAEQMLAPEVSAALEQNGARMTRSRSGKIVGYAGEVMPLGATGIEIPCGGMVSTLDDLSVYFAMLAEGGAWQGERILHRRTVDLMRANQISAEHRSEMWQWSSSNLGFGYGLGYRTMMDFATAGFYLPEGSFGWDGAAGCYLLANPAQRFALAFTEQSLPHHILETIPRVLGTAAGTWEDA